jgi:acetyl-CoA acetyltransferase
VTADRILAAALEGLVLRVELTGGEGGATRTSPPSVRGVGRGMVEDVVVGNVLQPGAGAATARMAALCAGIKVYFRICHISYCTTS